MSEHLFEFEVGDVINPIRQAADELAAGACPTPLRLADIGVGIDGGSYCSPLLPAVAVSSMSSPGAPLSQAIC
jgi:hypothetical protein